MYKRSILKIINKSIRTQKESELSNRMQKAPIILWNGEMHYTIIAFENAKIYHYPL